MTGLVPMTLTVELGLDNVKMNQHGQISRPEVILCKNYCPNTQYSTPTGPIARPGSLKSSVLTGDNND